MSFVEPPGLRSSAYYAIMAGSMAEHIDDVLQNGRTLPAKIQRGVHAEFRSFLVSAKSALFEERMQPVEAASDCRILVMAFAETARVAGPTYGDLHDVMQPFCDLADRLTKPGMINSMDAGRLFRLKLCLERIAFNGDSDAYARAMDVTRITRRNRS